MLVAFFYEAISQSKEVVAYITYFVVHYICMYYPNSHLHGALMFLHAEATQRSPGIGAALPPLLFSRRIVRHPPFPPSRFFPFPRPAAPGTVDTTTPPPGGFLQQKNGEDPGNKGGRDAHVDRAAFARDIPCPAYGKLRCCCSLQVFRRHDGHEGHEAKADATTLGGLLLVFPYSILIDAGFTEMLPDRSMGVVCLCRPMISLFVHLASRGEGLVVSTERSGQVL